MFSLASSIGHQARPAAPPYPVRANAQATGAGTKAERGDDNVSVHSFDLAHYSPVQVPRIYALNVGGTTIDVSDLQLFCMPAGNKLVGFLRANAPQAGSGQRLFLDRDPTLFRRILGYYLNAQRLPDALDESDVSALRMEAESLALADLLLECDAFYPLRQRVYRAGKEGQPEVRLQALQTLAKRLAQFGWSFEAQDVSQQAAQLRAALYAHAVVVRPPVGQAPLGANFSLIELTRPAPADAATLQPKGYLGWEPGVDNLGRQPAFAARSPQAPSGRMPVPELRFAEPHLGPAGYRPLSYGTQSTGITDASLPLTPPCVCCSHQGASLDAGALAKSWPPTADATSKVAFFSPQPRRPKLADAAQGTFTFRAADAGFKLFPPVAFSPPTAPNPAPWPTPELTPATATGLQLGLQADEAAPGAAAGPWIARGDTAAAVAPLAQGASGPQRPHLPRRKASGAARQRKSYLVPPSYPNVTNVRARATAAPAPAVRWLTPAVLARHASAGDFNSFGATHDRVARWQQHVALTAAGHARPGSIAASEPLDVASFVASAGWSRPPSPGTLANEPSEPWFSPNFLRAALPWGSENVDAQAMPVD